MTGLGPEVLEVVRSVREELGVEAGLLLEQLGAVAQVEIGVAQPRRHRNLGGVVRVGCLGCELGDAGAGVVRIAAGDPFVHHGQAVEGERGT